MANRKVLLVEGPDDEYALGALSRGRGFPDFDEIKPHGGADELLRAIPVTLSLSEEGDTFGIVIDADTDLAARWQSIRYRALAAGYQEVPDQPEPEGTILIPPPNSRLPRLGIWIMPNNRTNGILENFLEFLVPDGDDLLDYAKSCVENLPSRRFIDNDMLKALIHTWLAWQSDPGKPYGTAITARFLDPNVPEADVLAGWLERLFFPGS